MIVIVGLGNPGEKYKGTRHNIGFRVLDELKSKISNDQFQMTNFKYKKKLDAEVARIGEVMLVKPMAYMNRSGVVITRLQGVALQNLYVVIDDLDITLGSFKIQFARGPKAHNGLQSIYKALGTKDFWHVRVGIDNRQQYKKDGEKYVLGKFTKEEREVIDRVVEKIVVDFKDHVFTRKIG